MKTGELIMMLIALAVVSFACGTRFQYSLDHPPVVKGIHSVFVVEEDPKMQMESICLHNHMKLSYYRINRSANIEDSFNKYKSEDMYTFTCK